MKRILFIIDRLNEGAGRVVYDIVKNLDKKEFEPVIASIYRDGNLVDEFNKHKVSRMVLVNDKNKVVGIVRDIAVFKYMTFYKYDREVKKRFARDYSQRLY